MQKNVTPGRRKGCPNYSPEFKQHLVAASCEPGMSISKLALENGINANLLFKWRQQWREGKLLLPSSESPQLLPVTLRNGLNGNPEALTDGNGVLKWRQREPVLWGKTQYEDLTDGQGVMQNLRFQGQYLDRETGLHYNLLRYYDPECGRFTQQDPIRAERRGKLICLWAESVKLDRSAWIKLL